jgi:hypothetical protein
MFFRDPYDPDQEQVMDVITGDTPTYWHINEETGQLKVIPTPTVDGATIHLNVWRLPITYLTTDNLEGFPEFHTQFHYYLAHYAAAKIFTLHDEELSENDASAKHFGLFNQAIVKAKRRFNRLLNRNKGNGILAAGRMGWSWPK